MSNGFIWETLDSALFSGQFASGGGSMASGIVRSITDRPDVWDAVLGSSLTDMDVEEDPKRAVNALYLKTSALATAILDGAGRERAAAMIANLLRDHRGATFTAADLDRAAQEAGVDLAGLVGDFLHQTDLPGFIVSPAELERLPDDDQGTPQYQGPVVCPASIASFWVLKRRVTLFYPVLQRPDNAATARSPQETPSRR